MGSNRKISRLDKLAFEALLRYRREYSNKHDIAYQNNPVVMEYMQKDFLPFLQCIANADPRGVKEFLNRNSLLAAIARGTVTTASGYTYENVTAIQLTYLMDDDEMQNMMLPYIHQLSSDIIQKIEEQLAQKVTEVEKQRMQFKPYDFSEIVSAVNNWSANTENTTGKAFLNLKNYFSQKIIREGKSWIKEHLQEGFCIYRDNRTQWNHKQIDWYMINIIGYLQTLVEKCFEQECSQGLDEIIRQQPNKRSTQVKNHMNNKYLNYRGTDDLSLVLGEHYYVDLYGLVATWSSWQTRPITILLKNYLKQKNQRWQNISDTISKRNLYTQAC